MAKPDDRRDLLLRRAAAFIHHQPRIRRVSFHERKWIRSRER